MLVTGTFISYHINIGDLIRVVVWFLSGIIFGSCCDGDLWLDQVKCVPLAPVIDNLEAGNHHHQVLKLEPLELCHHRELVLVLGYVMFLTVIVKPIIIFIYLSS